MSKTALDRLMEKHDTIGIFLGIAILAVVGLGFALITAALRGLGLLEAILLLWVGAAFAGAIVVGFRTYFRR